MLSEILILPSKIITRLLGSLQFIQRQTIFWRLITVNPKPGINVTGRIDIYGRLVWDSENVFFHFFIVNVPNRDPDIHNIRSNNILFILVWPCSSYSTEGREKGSGAICAFLKIILSKSNVSNINLNILDFHTVDILGLKCFVYPWIHSAGKIRPSPNGTGRNIHSAGNIIDGVRRVSGLRREPEVSVEDLTHICVSHWKVESDPPVRNLCGLRTIWSYN